MSDEASRTRQFIRDCCDRPHDCKWGGMGGCGYEGRKEEMMPSDEASQVVRTLLDKWIHEYGMRESSPVWNKVEADLTAALAAAEGRGNQRYHTMNHLIRALEVAQPLICSFLCPSVGKVGEDWTHVQQCQSLTLTLHTVRSEHTTDSEYCWCWPTIQEHEHGRVIVHHKTAIEGLKAEEVSDGA